MAKQRQSNIELLRVMAAVGVILLHYNSAALDLVQPGSVNEHLLLALESMVICAVNLFMLIAGYFGCTGKRCSLAKLLCLLLQVSLFRVCVTGLNMYRAGYFSGGELVQSLLPGNYFVILYAVTGLLSPYIYLLLQRLGAKGRRQLAAILVLLFAAWPTAVDVLEMCLGWNLQGLSTIGLYGSQSGYSIVNFLMLYVIGAWLKMDAVTMKPGKAMAAYLGLTALIFLWSKFSRSTAWAYCNPLVVFQAVAVFLFACNLRLRSRVINSLAAGCFTSYIVHSRFLHFFRIYLAVQRHPLFLLRHCVMTCVSIFLLCWVFSLVYGLTEKPLRRLLEKCLCRIPALSEEVLRDKEQV